MKLVYAEKPSVGREYAEVLGAISKHDGYFEGNGWIVTWGFGHLVELEEPDFYLDESVRSNRWTKEQLPIIPDSFTFRAREDVKKQLTTIRNLARRSDVEFLVNGADAGREGEAIFRYVYNFLNLGKPTRRLWTSSLTHTALKSAFADLKPSKDYDNLFEAAIRRNEADWLVGMNATRALTISAGSGQTLSLGRVQTPTLCMICERYLQFKNFKSVPYYTVRVGLKTKGEDVFFVNIPEKFDTKEAAESYMSKLPNSWTVEKRIESEVVDSSPLPFNIDDVQIKANQKFGMKAQQTLNCVQALYEAKMVTYPRTGSRYLAEDMKESVAESIRNLAVLGYSEKFVDACSKINPGTQNETMYDNSELSDHHAIIPTFENIKTREEEFKGMSNSSTSAQDLKRIYDLICKQIVMAAMPDCLKKKITYKFMLGDDEVSVSGLSITREGWRAVCSKDEEDEDEKNAEENQKLPSMQQGDICTLAQGNVNEKHTTPEPLLTEASLLKFMEGAGKLIKEDKSLKAAIKKCGIGTPATRAAAIEVLFDRKYINREGKKLVPTDRGLDLYTVIKGEDIAKVEMTAEWESKLQQIECGKYSASEFLDEIKDYTKDIVEALINVDAESIRRNVVAPVAECPICHGGVYERDKYFICSQRKKDDPNSCRFFINKDFIPYKDGKAVHLKKKDLFNLIALKETSEYQVEVKPGEVKAKKFIYDTVEKRVKYVMPMRKDTGLVCPKCGGRIIETDKTFKCENNNYLKEDSCPICVFKDTKMGVTLGIDNIHALLSGEQLSNVKLKIRNGVVYEGALYYDFDSYGIKRVSQRRETGLVCPKCGGKILETDMFYKCENSIYGDSDSCNIYIFKDQGMVLSFEIVKTLLEGRTTDYYTLSGKNGEYRRSLRFDFNEGKVVKIAPEKKIEQTGLKCPKCGGPVVLEDSRKYVCSKSECDFTVWSSRGEVDITIDILKKIIENGESDLIKGFKGSKGTFSAKLKFEDPKTGNYKIAYDFGNKK